MFEIVAILSAATLVGLPVVLWSYDADRVNLLKLVALASASGLLASGLVLLILVRLDLYRPSSLLATLVLLMVLMWFIAARRRHHTLPSLALRKSSLFFVALLPVALLLRLNPTYFIYEIGDMGHYINTANTINDVGAHTGGFPHLFPATLAAAGALLGEHASIFLVPAIGILTWAIWCALINAIAGRLAAVALGALLAVHIIPVWFSRFPVSEALYALAISLMLYWLKIAIDQDNKRVAILVGLLPGVLLLIRGNALLLAPVLFAILAMAAIAMSARTYSVLRVSYIVAVLSMFVAYIYNVTWVRAYFYETQMSRFGGSIVDFLGAASLDRLSIASVIAVVSLGYGSLWILDRVRAYASQQAKRELSRLLFLIGPICFWIIVSTVFSTMGHGLAEAGVHFGLLLLLLAAVGMFASPAWLIDEGTKVIVVTSALLSAIFGLLFAIRLSSDLGHAFLLYWDRYLISEVFPAVVVLAGAGFGTLMLLAPQEKYGRRVAGVVMIAFAIVSMVVVGGPAWTLRNIVMFEDAYVELYALNEMALTEGEGPVWYSGYGQKLEGWIFPNTFRAIALPLEETFGRTVPNIRGLEAFGPDPRVAPQEVRTALKRSNNEVGYLIRAVDVQHDECFWESPTDAVGRVGRVRIPIEVLRDIPGVINTQVNEVVLCFDVFAFAVEGN